MGIEKTGGVRGFLERLTNVEFQKTEEAAFKANVDQVKEKLDTLGKRVVNFLETTALDFIKKPLISGLTPIQTQVDEDGEEIPLTLGQKLSNFHKVTVAQGGDEFAINAGATAHALTRKALQPITKAATFFNREHMGATVQNTVALTVGALVRGIFFALSQLAHLRTAFAAVGIAVVGALTVAVPQVACGILALKTSNLTKEVNGLKGELKAKARAEKAQAEQSATNTRRATIALGIALAAGAAFAAYKNPEAVAATVAFGKSIASKIGSMFARKTTGFTFAPVTLPQIGGHVAQPVTYLNGTQGLI